MFGDSRGGEFTQRFEDIPPGTDKLVVTLSRELRIAACPAASRTRLASLVSASVHC